MQMKLTNEMVKEVFGEVLFIGIEQRKVYDSEKRAYTDEVLSTKVNLGCEKKEDSFSVTVESAQIPNIKKWGKVSFDGLVYDPYASVSSYERDGKTQSRGVLNDRFLCKAVHPTSPQDRLADDDGVILKDKK